MSFSSLKSVNFIVLLSALLVSNVVVVVVVECGRNYHHSAAELALTDQVSISPQDCSPGETPIFVHTAGVASGKYFDRRTTIRKTWGSEASHLRMRVFFVVGTPLDRSVQEALKQESATHRDILQFGFVENYWNITLKAIAELKWAAAHCSQAAYLVKVDDDVILNMEMLAHIVRTRSLPPGMTGQRQHIEAHREPGHKWYMPPTVYSQSEYEFLMGFGYVLSMDRLQRLLAAITTYPGQIVDIDDVFLTGLVADHGQVERHNSLRFRFLCSPDACAMERSLMTHGCSDPANSERLYRLWKAADTRGCQQKQQQQQQQAVVVPPVVSLGKKKLERRTPSSTVKSTTTTTTLSPPKVVRRARSPIGAPPNVQAKFANNHNLDLLVFY